MSPKTTAPATVDADEQFTEKRTWRDALDSLMSLIHRGDDVDPVELADTRSKADAEAEIETSRRTRHEKKKIEREQRAARDAITAALADIDPDPAGAALARMRKAYTEFWDTVAAETIAAGEHREKLLAVARMYPAAGYTRLNAYELAMGGTPDGVDPDHHVRGRDLVWDGVRYTSPKVNELTAGPVDRVGQFRYEYWRRDYRAALKRARG